MLRLKTVVNTFTGSAVGGQTVAVRTAARVAASCVDALVLTPVQLHTALVYV